LFVSKISAPGDAFPDQSSAAGRIRQAAYHSDLVEALWLVDCTVLPSLEEEHHGMATCSSHICPQEDVSVHQEGGRHGSELQIEGH
jgi:predicted dinucleotide-binding enzyme